MVGGEAGIPTAPPLRRITGKIRHFFHAAAKTSWANHRAIGARKTSCRHIVPAWMLHIPVEQFLDTRRIHPPSHLRNCANNHAACSITIAFRCSQDRKLAYDLLAALAAGFNQEFMTAILEYFR